MLDTLPHSIIYECGQIARFKYALLPTLRRIALWKSHFAWCNGSPDETDNARLPVGIPKNDALQRCLPLPATTFNLSRVELPHRTPAQVTRDQIWELDCDNAEQFLAPLRESWRRIVFGLELNQQGVPETSLYCVRVSLAGFLHPRFYNRDASGGTCTSVMLIFLSNLLANSSGSWRLPHLLCAAVLATSLWQEMCSYT